MPIPLQSAATDEVEVIMAALVTPAPHVDAPIIFGHVEDMRAVAEHLHAFGLRHHPDEQRIWYVPPRPDASILEAGAGRWIEGPEPGVAPEEAARAVEELDGAAALVAALTDEQRDALRKALEEDS